MQAKFQRAVCIEIENKIILKHDNTITPMLTESNKNQKVRFCLSVVRIVPNQAFFDSLMNYVHVHEKWFYPPQFKPSFYLSSEKRNQTGKQNPKNFIPKVSFRCAIVGPKYDSYRKQNIDCKL